MFNARL